MTLGTGKGGGGRGGGWIGGIREIATRFPAMAVSEDLGTNRIIRGYPPNLAEKLIKFGIWVGGRGRGQNSRFSM